LKKMYVFEILLTFSQKNGSVGRRRNTRRRGGRLLNAKQWHYKLPSLQGVESGAGALTLSRHYDSSCAHVKCIHHQIIFLNRVTLDVFPPRLDVF
jgi:hypothetical protein